MSGLELKCSQCGELLHVVSVRSAIAVTPCKACYGNLSVAIHSLDAAIGDFKQMMKAPMINGLPLQSENVNATLSVLKKDAFLMRLLEDVRGGTVNTKDALYQLLNYTEPTE